MSCDSMREWTVIKKVEPRSYPSGGTYERGASGERPRVGSDLYVVDGVEHRFEQLRVTERTGCALGTPDQVAIFWVFFGRGDQELRLALAIS